ncbi:hypothetical protein ACN28G_05860 [Micromonospora sp. WMMA1923]|uniref:hypothetical protein n=1 Tax=Micromonospora sp. WMMA1923 TaxID=3404125 RepID=UPI003B942C91
MRQHGHQRGTADRSAETHPRRDTAVPTSAGGRPVAREPALDRGRPAEPGRALDGHRVDDAAQVLALQRAVGNRGVGAFLAVQRMMPAPAQGQAAGQAPAAVVNPVEIQQLQAYHATVRNAQVRSLLDELIPHLQRVTTWNQTPGRGGGNTRNLGPPPTGGPNQYQINYAAGGTDSERIAILVHELTHVAVNEAYHSDMLNYPVAPLPATSTATTEGQRQTERIGATNRNDLDSFRAQVVGNAATLLELLPQAGFTQARMQEAADKLSAHTAQNPLHEYDAVLSHLLVWADHDGVSRTTPFYEKLTEMVTEAAGWREAGIITPTADAGSLPAEQARALTARRAMTVPTPAPAAGPSNHRTIRGRAMNILNRLAERLSRDDRS